MKRVYYLLATLLLLGLGGCSEDDGIDNSVEILIPEILIENLEYRIDADNGSSLVIMFCTNVNYQTTISYPSQDEKDWLSLSCRNYDKNESIGVEATIWAKENQTDAERIAYIDIHAENISKRITITQNRNGEYRDISSEFDPDFAKVLEAKGIIADANRIALKHIKEIYVLEINNCQLTSLKGIEFFESLTKLDCDNNQLASLDVSGCTALTGLNCYGNQLTSLDVSGCTALTGLSCFHNQLTSLDVSGCTALTKLNCDNNQLASLDVSGCTALTGLNCYGNQLTSLDVSGCTALTGLSCFHNQLTSLDVSGCTALTKLNCHNNQLTSLDVSGCTALTQLNCYGNQLTSLDVSGYTALTWLDCDNNQLTSLDVSGCTALTDCFSCANNQLTSLDVSDCTALRSFSCGRNQLTSLDVSGYTALIELFCNSNQLTSLDVSGCTALTKLDCDNNQLASLDVSGCTALTGLNCYGNQLTSLDVSGCTALTGLSCFHNQLTSLDVSDCTALTGLNCYGNQLTSLDVSGCTALTELWCGSNQLTSLDVSGYTALTRLNCYGNQLTSLDVSGCTALTELDCANNQLTSLDVSDCTALTELWCGSNQLTSLDITKNQMLKVFACANNPGDGVIFSVKTWFDNSSIPIDFTSSSWVYDGRMITIDYYNKEYLPVITLGEISNLKETSVTLNAVISKSGVPCYTELGFVYALEPNPSLENNIEKIICSALDNRTYSANITNLITGDTYYVRAYAISELGLSYSEELEFILQHPTHQKPDIYYRSGNTITNKRYEVSSNPKAYQYEATIELRGYVLGQIDAEHLDCYEFGFYSDFFGSIGNATLESIDKRENYFTLRTTITYASTSSNYRPRIEVKAWMRVDGETIYSGPGKLDLW